jgi:hypothetical protein
MAEIEILVKGKNQANLDKLATDAKKAGKEVGDGLQKGFKEGEQASERTRKQIGDDLDKTAKKAKTSGEEGGKGYGEGFASAVNTAQGGPQAAVDGALEKIGGGGGAAAAGAAIGGLLIKGFSDLMAREDLGGVLSAQLGGTVQDAGRYGHLAGKIYADNYGNAIEDAAAGIKAVVQNKLVAANATDAELAKMSEMAMTVAKVTEEDANAVAQAAHHMLVNGLASSAEEAFDIITRASQNGLDVSHDLLDTLVEYSTKFRDLGLNGQDAMGLISQALKAGARDTDTAADALKEFAIRAQDGSVSTARGFRTIGLDANSMGEAIAAGGSRARAALGETLDGLRAIHEPIIRDQAAVDLFGTKAEDLGDALYGMNLHTVGKEMDEVAGATERAGKSMETSGQTVERAWRNTTNALTDFAAHEIRGVEAANDIAETIARGFKPEALAGTPVADSEWVKAYKERVDEAAHAWDREGSSIKKSTRSLEENIKVHQESMQLFESLAGAEITYQKAVDDATEAVKKNGKTVDIHTEKGRENKQALLDMADSAWAQISAMDANGESAANLTVTMATARDQFIDVARKMGMSGEAANHLADQLRLIPRDIQMYMGLHGQEAAENTIRTLKGHLIDLTNRPYVASIVVTEKHPAGGGKMFIGYGHGGVVGHAAEGGPRGNRVLVGEQGPEIVDLAPGSMVHSNADSQRMMAGGGGSGRSPETTVRFTGELDSYMATAWMKAYQDGLIRIEART